MKANSAASHPQNYLPRLTGPSVNLKIKRRNKNHETENDPHCGDHWTVHGGRFILRTHQNWLQRLAWLDRLGNRQGEWPLQKERSGCGPCLVPHLHELAE